MTASGKQASARPFGTAPLEWPAHLIALWAVGVAQPLLSSLGPHAAFFVAHGVGGAGAVAFAFAVVLVPPLLLSAVPLALRLVDRRAGWWTQVALVGALGAVAAESTLVDRVHMPSGGLFAIASVCGAALGVLYARTAFVPRVLVVLALVAAAFVALFLDASGTRALLRAVPVGHKAVIASKTPVVLMVFDELPLASLLDSTGQIDATRYPNFAQLSHDSTWYRRARTVHTLTEWAVPAILDAKLPRPDTQPVLASHPDNLFTALAGTYEIHATQNVTNLCPRLCTGARTTEVTGGLGTLASDAAIVALHQLAPSSLEADLPALQGSWGNFGPHRSLYVRGKHRPPRILDTAWPYRWPPDGTAVFTGPLGSRTVHMRSGLASFSGRDRSLDYLHELLPHKAWEFYADGHRYVDGDRQEGARADGTYGWGPDPVLDNQMQLRHLLQLQYTDRMLSGFVATMRRTGLWDKAIIVVVADHGITFAPNQGARDARPATAADLAYVPLFVRIPGQPHVVSDRHALTIDIVPTIFDALHSRVPWRVDGQSLLRAERPRHVNIVSASGSLPLTDALDAQLAQTVRNRIATFGEGSADLFRFGPHRELIGAPVATATRAGAHVVAATFQHAAQLRSYDPASIQLVPGYICGSLARRVAPGTVLAIAVNGTVQGTTVPFGPSGRQQFCRLVPMNALRAGANDVQVLALR